MSKSSTAITIEVSPTLLRTIHQSCRVMVREQEQEMGYLLEVAALGLWEGTDFAYRQFVKSVQKGKPLTSVQGAIERERRECLDTCMVEDLPSIIAQELGQRKRVDRERICQARTPARPNRTQRAMRQKRTKAVVYEDRLEMT